MPGNVEYQIVYGALMLVLCQIYEPGSSATRKALKVIRKVDREETLDEILLDHWPDSTPGPEQKQLRSQYTAELKKAIRDAFAALEVRQRNLLRQHILDELTIDDLARLYRVHRATCARWLADARAELGKLTRKKLMTALGMPTNDLDSLLRFLAPFVATWGGDRG